MQPGYLSAVTITRHLHDIRLRDFDERQIELRVTKKRNIMGYVSKVYEMTPDLWKALCRAQELRKKNRGGAASLPSDYLFITKQGKPDTKESFKSLWRVVRKKPGLKPREITFHDMRAKAASDEISDASAKQLLHHQDVKITRHVFCTRCLFRPRCRPRLGAGKQLKSVASHAGPNVSRTTKNGSRLLVLTR